MANVNANISFDTIMQYCPFLKETIENKINEEVAAVKKENEQYKETIDSLGKQLATEKLERLKNVNALNALGKELTEIKLRNMGGK